MACLDTMTGFKVDFLGPPTSSISGIFSDVLEARGFLTAWEMGWMKIYNTHHSVNDGFVNMDIDSLVTDSRIYLICLDI